MSKRPNRVARFWQELKRRKVFGVITTYAATSYIIIEVVNNLTGPFHLPEWIPTITGLLLVAGFPVAIILSWIFDFTTQGFKKTEPAGSESTAEPEKRHGKRILRPSLILNIILLLAVIVLAYPRIFRNDTLENKSSSGKRISVAVMPFQNMTNDSIWDIWQSGIQDMLITTLSNSGDLKVRQKESVNRLIHQEAPENYASLLPSISTLLSRKLDADVLISGSINISGSVARLNAQLTNTKTQEVFKSFQIEGRPEKLLFSVDTLSGRVMNYLIISKLVRQQPKYMQHQPLTTSPEAYKCYLLGESARSKRDNSTAIKMFTQALSLDSNYLQMKLMLSVACTNQGLYQEARAWSDKGYREIDRMPLPMKILANKLHAFFYETPAEEIKYIRQIQEIDDNYPGTYYDIGMEYSSMMLYNKAIPEFEKSLELYKKMGMKPWWVYNYTELGYAFHNTRQYGKEKKLYIKAEKDFPNESNLTWRQAILFMTIKDTSAARKYLNKYISIYRENAWSQAAMARNLGWAYSQAGDQDKAEASFRKAIELEPGNGFWYYYLAYHLIDKNRNIDEGLLNVDKAIALNPAYEWMFLDCKGWGLYKKGKVQEALDVLERSRELQPYYNQEKLIHFEEVRKAANQLKTNQTL